MNLYGYVGNVPLSFRDPTGEFAWFWIFVSGGLSVKVGEKISAVSGESYTNADASRDFVLGALPSGSAFKTYSATRQYFVVKKYQRNVRGLTKCALPNAAEAGQLGLADAGGHIGLRPGMTVRDLLASLQADAIDGAFSTVKLSLPNLIGQGLGNTGVLGTGVNTVQNAESLIGQ